jgi:hypothetical protein
MHGKQVVFGDIEIRNFEMPTISQSHVLLRAQAGFIRPRVKLRTAAKVTPDRYGANSQPVALLTRGKFSSVCRGAMRNQPSSPDQTTASLRNFSAFLTVAAVSLPSTRLEPSMIAFTSSRAFSATASDFLGPPNFLSGK